MEKEQRQAPVVKASIKITTTAKISFIRPSNKPKKLKHHEKKEVNQSAHILTLTIDKENRRLELHFQA